MAAGDTQYIGHYYIIIKWTLFLFCTPVGPMRIWLRNIHKYYYLCKDEVKISTGTCRPLPHELIGIWKWPYLTNQNITVSNWSRTTISVWSKILRIDMRRIVSSYKRRCILSDCSFLEEVQEACSSPVIREKDGRRYRMTWSAIKTTPWSEEFKKIDQKLVLVEDRLLIGLNRILPTILY